MLIGCLWAASQQAICKEGTSQLLVLLDLLGVLSGVLIKRILDLRIDLGLFEFVLGIAVLILIWLILVGFSVGIVGDYPYLRMLGAGRGWVVLEVGVVIVDS